MLDHNDLIKRAMEYLSKIPDATPIARCGCVWEISKILVALQDGISQEREAHLKEKKCLDDQIQDLLKKLAGDINPEKEVYGGETIRFDLSPKAEEVKNNEQTA